MKLQEEIEQLAKKQKGCSKEYCDSIDEQYGYLNGYIEGYTQCQEDMQTLLNDLFSLWQSLAEVGEIGIGQNFTKKYEELKKSLNKQR